MANSAHLVILKKGVRYWNWWREENPDLQPDLSGADLSKMNLSQINLKHTNLQGTNFEGANLTKASLDGANCVSANFKNTNLNVVILDNVNLKAANLEGAIISTSIEGNGDQKREVRGPKFVQSPNISFNRIAVHGVSGIAHADEFVPPLPPPTNKLPFLTRYINIDLPKTTLINTEFSLFIQVLLESPEPNSPSINIEDMNPSKLPEVEVVLRANNSQIIGSNTQILQIDREEDSEARFILIPQKEGEQQIRADFYQNGRRIGTVKKTITIVTEQTTNSAVTQSSQISNLSIKVISNIAPPDLELCIEIDPTNFQSLYFTLHSTKQNIRYHHVKCGQSILQDLPLNKMQTIYQKLSQFATNNPRKLVPKNHEESSSDVDWQDQDAERQFKIIGNQLWDELIPKDLKNYYWDFRSKVSSLLITSDEPWIPWEMVKPYRVVNGSEEQDPFWCEQFSLSRWLSSESGTIDELSIDTIFPVAPTQTNLPAVQEEINFIEQLIKLRSKIHVLPINQLKDIISSFSNPHLSILHFACHGIFDDTLPNDSAIKLENDQILSPSDLPHKFVNFHPLIFINACYGGRLGFSFTKIGGWAEKCVNAEAGAFIGAMWEVNDALALEFAKTFYQVLLEESQTIADAFREARKVIKQKAPYNSTWLAYTLYADPQAQIGEEK